MCYFTQICILLIGEKKKQYSIGRYLHIINRIYFIKLKPNFISTFLKAKMLSNAIHDTLMFNIFQLFISSQPVENRDENLSM